MPRDTSTFHILVIKDRERLRRYVSPLSLEHLAQKGLRSEAIMGELSGPNLSPDTFQQNPLFLKFLGWVIAKHGPRSAELLDEVRRQQNGYVYLIDHRSQSADGSVPPEDIIGGFEVRDGAIVRYHSSPNYQLYTKAGLMSLPGTFHELLVEELSKLD